MHNEQQVTPHIYWVGGNDFNSPRFENLIPLKSGVTYNSYFIDDEKTAVIDTTDTVIRDLFIGNVSHLLHGRKLDYIVVNHMEPDHSGSLLALAMAYPEAKIVASAQALKMLGQYFQVSMPERYITSDEKLVIDLGMHKLRFLKAPMVHWPEVMVEYEKSEKILFSADGFGKFGALDADEDWACEARRYYFNIVGKYGAQVQALLKKAATLDIQTICPLHGPILKENLGYYIGKYMTWSSYEPEDDGVLVAYASIHGNTKKAAEKMKEILEAKGAKKVAITDLSRDDVAEAIEDAFRYDKLVLAAASYDASVFPCMETFLNKLTNKNYQNRKIAIIENGSWAPTAARVMKSYVEKMKKITLCEKTVTIKSAMKDADVIAMEELADELLA